MTTYRFDHPKTTLEQQQGYNGVNLPDGVELGATGESGTLVAEFYDRLESNTAWSRTGNEGFPVTWDVNSRAEPIINPDNLPDGVSKIDVESVLQGLVNDGWL